MAGIIPKEEVEQSIGRDQRLEWMDPITAISIADIGSPMEIAEKVTAAIMLTIGMHRGVEKQSSNPIGVNNAYEQRARRAKLL